jgi:hypothetical protein
MQSCALGDDTWSLLIYLGFGLKDVSSRTSPVALLLAALRKSSLVLSNQSDTEFSGVPSRVAQTFFDVTRSVFVQTLCFKCPPVYNVGDRRVGEQKVRMRWTN